MGTRMFHVKPLSIVHSRSRAPPPRPGRSMSGRAPRPYWPGWSHRGFESPGGRDDKYIVLVRRAGGFLASVDSRIRGPDLPGLNHEPERDAEHRIKACSNQASALD